MSANGLILVAAMFISAQTDGVKSPSTNLPPDTTFACLTSLMETMWSSKVPPADFKMTMDASCTANEYHAKKLYRAYLAKLSKSELKEVGSLEDLDSSHAIMRSSVLNTYTMLYYKTPR